MARYGYTGGNAVPKLLGLLVVALLLTFMVKNPVEAATWLRGAAQVAGAVIEGIGTFMRTSVSH